MIYQCDKCNLIHEDDDLECTCGCKDVTVLEFCDVCSGLWYSENLYRGVCSECLEDEEEYE